MVPRRIFSSWFGTEDVFADLPANDAAMTGPVRPGSMHAATRGNSGGDAAIQSPEPDLIIFTLYNKTAYWHIRSNKLYLQAELKRLQTVGLQDSAISQQRSVPPFPPEAAVLLTAWWPVAKAQITALPVWDPGLNPPRLAGNSYITWQRVVGIDASAQESGNGKN